jgi:hypothetical protein
MKSAMAVTPDRAGVMEVCDQVPEHLPPGAPPPVGGPGENERAETEYCRDFESDEKLHI